MSKSSPMTRMVCEAKKLVRAWGPHVSWNDTVWHIRNVFSYRQAQGMHRYLIFTKPGSTKRNSREPLPQPYADFAKALTMLFWNQRRVGTAHLSYFLRCVRLLVMELLDRKALPHQITVEVFHSLLNKLAGKGLKQMTLYGVGSKMVFISSELDFWKITPSQLAFCNPVFHPRKLEVDHRKLVETGKREREEFLPTFTALAAYAECTNKPLDDNERILLRVIDLHVVLGTRIGETLTVPLNCWVEEAVHDEQGKPIRDLEGQVIKRYGIRFYPEKGYDIAIHWLADQDVELAGRSVKELTRLCAPARKVARWLEDHPGRIWEYHPDQILPISTLIKHLHYSTPDQFHHAMHCRGIHVARARPWGSPVEDMMFRAGDIERAYRIPNYKLVPLHDEGGRPVLKLSEALCVKFYGQFSRGEGYVNFRRPDIIHNYDIFRALGGSKEKSIFDVHGIKELKPDGRIGRMKMRTHAVRHWKNALYDKGGLTDIQQTWAMNRKDVNQTRNYQHRTAQESTAPMRQFLDMKYDERMDVLRDGLRGGTLQGPLADAYKELRANDPTSAEAFLKTQAAGIHVTPWGICSNDFSLKPCRKYLQCFDNCRHYHRTCSPEETKLLKELRLNIENSIKNMKANSTGEAGADRWVEMMETKLNNLDKVLAISKTNAPESSPIQIFPEGLDKSNTGRFGMDVL